MFKKEIIRHSTNRIPNTIKLKLINLGIRTFEWEIDIEDLENTGIFTVDKLSGVLNEEHREEILIATFSPLDAGEYD